MYMRVRGEGGTLFPKDRCVVSGDGTHIAYGVMGKGEQVVVLNAGFCCPDNFWKYLAPSLARRYRVLIWNYRGAGVSGMPREPGYRARNYDVEDFSLDRYAEDLRAILDHEAIEQAVLVGHSMGTQVSLEAYRLMPKRIRAMVSVTGPYASAIQTFYNTTVAPRIYPFARVALARLPGPFRFVWRGIFSSPLPHPLAIQLGALGPATAAEDMRPYYDHIADLEPQMVLKMAEAMHRHSAEDLLRRVKVPTLVVVGEADNFVPPWIGHVMASRIPVAELVSIPGGTHGTIIEFPKQVNRAITDFLSRHLDEGRTTVSLADKRRTKKRATKPGVAKGRAGRTIRGAQDTPPRR